MQLNAFPPDVIAHILNVSNDTLAIQLWKCGDRLLNHKLQYGGGQSLALVKYDDYTKHEKLPQLLHDGVFYSLTKLSIMCGFALPQDTLLHVGAQLQVLTIMCPNLATVVNGIDYATRWPMLQQLKLCHTIPAREPKGVLNLVSQLPPTVIKLATPRFEDATLMQVLKQLPADLVSLAYATATHMADLLVGTNEQDVLLALPRSLKDLRIGITIWRFQTPTDANALMPLLPTQLNELYLDYRSSTPVVLPRHLTNIVVNHVQSLFNDTWLHLSPSVTDLTIHSISRTAPLHADESQLFSPSQWKAFLPPRLIKFYAWNGSIPLRWSEMSRHVQIWPTTLQKLMLSINCASQLYQFALPSSICSLHLYIKHFDINGNIAIDGMVTVDQTPCLASLGLNFDLLPHIIRQLPSTLTYLSASDDRDRLLEQDDLSTVLDYRGLPLLKSLSIGRESTKYDLRLPDGLQSLNCDVYAYHHEDDVLTRPQIHRFFSSLPRQLTYLRIMDGMSLNRFDAELVKLLPLPLSLHTLMIRCGRINVLDVLAALPRSLTVLELQIIHDDHDANKPILQVDASQLKTVLPPNLKRLVMSGFTFNGFDFNQPIESLHVAKFTTTQPLSFEKLFPNAHTIKIDTRP